MTDLLCCVIASLVRINGVEGSSDCYEVGRLWAHAYYKSVWDKSCCKDQFCYKPLKEKDDVQGSSFHTDFLYEGAGVPHTK